ncbi:MAG: T9SS type A sorting domain-containing protein, partial [Candidatus Marinimicrobia bacterium]|nr:T9SS type A sorting domain-containing protein [Candidatus Neomarinimicrobiota bacterium]
DDEYATANLPFSFSFYGQAKTSVKISTNGYLTFGDDGTDYSNDPIPTLLDPNDYMAPFWHDLVAGTTNSTIHYYHDLNQNQFIVQYANVSLYDSAGSYTFQVILDSDGSIVFQYLTMAKTVFLSGNLDARLIPVANVWSSITPLTLVADGSFATGTSDLNDLTQTATSLEAGDVIAISGSLPDGSGISTSFNYGPDGTTIDDLLASIEVAYAGRAVAWIFDGKLTLVDVVAGDSNTSIALSSTADIDLPAFENSVPGFTGRAIFSTEVYDGLGFSHNLFLVFTKQEVQGQWYWAASFAGGNETVVDGGTGTIQFNSSGEIVSFGVDGAASGIIVGPGTGAAQFTIFLDVMGGKGLAGVTQFAIESSIEVTFATIGIEDRFGTDGLPAINGSSHRHDNFAIRFEPPASVGVIGIMGNPSGFSLAQNYPNPFNPITVINYALPVVSDVSLGIYDLLGRQIIVWRRSGQRPGNHYVQWSGRDDLGEPVASGVYIYVLRANTFSDTKKMLLLR